MLMQVDRSLVYISQEFQSLSNNITVTDKISLQQGSPIVFSVDHKQWLLVVTTIESGVSSLRDVLNVV